MAEQQFELSILASRIRAAIGSRYAWAAVAAVPSLVLAGPAGENVVAGNASVSRPDATTTHIQQSSHKTIIDWQDFSVGGNEYVQFSQPGTTAIALNRVVGGNPSAILGQISANGRVFLVNPRGVHFAPGSRVDVGGLVASILDIDNDDFMAGRYNFTRSAAAVANAGVVNGGTINVADGGFVVLAGDYSSNAGVIQGRLSTVVLASGSQMTLDVSDSGLIDFAVDAETVSALAGVENAGDIIADGGRILLTAKVADGLVQSAVNNEGLLQAHSIVESNGAVFLRAAGGDIEQNGVVDVSGTNGADGGGVIVHTDRDITLAAHSEISADGDGAGHGGLVRIIADGTLDFRNEAHISAHGGAESENTGGFVELSGHQELLMGGTVEVGAGGDLVLDPRVLTLRAGSGTDGNIGTTTGSYGGAAFVHEAFIEAQLAAGTDLTLIASSNFGSPGSITSSGASFSIDATAPAGNLSLQIAQLTFTSVSGSLGGGMFNCGSVGACSTPGTSFQLGALDAAGDIDLPNVSFNIAGGLTIRAGTATGNVSIGSVVAGLVSITAGNNITANDVTANGNVLLPAGPVTITAGNNITANDVTANGNVLLNTLPGGTLTVGNVSAASTQASIIAGNVSMGGAMLTNVGGPATIMIRGISSATITGPLTVMTTVGDASIEVDNFGGGLTFPGAITATTTGPGNATVDLRAGNGVLTIDNTVTATGQTATVILNGDSGVQVNDVVFANGATNGRIFTGLNSFGTGTIATGGPGELHATHMVSIDGGEGGFTNIDVVTNAPTIDLNAGFSFGGMSGSLDNTAFGGAADLNLSSGSGGYGGFGDMDFAFGGDLTFNDGIDASELLVSAGGDINLGANVFNVSGLADFSAGGDINNGPATIIAQALSMSASGNINLNDPGTTVAVGAGVVMGQGDPGLVSFAAGEGLTLPVTYANAYFKAGGNITINQLTLNAVFPYAVFKANEALTLPATVNGSFSDILVQITANNVNSTIGVEGIAAVNQAFNVNNADHFAPFPGTTIAIGAVGLAGTGHAADIFLGENGPVNIGSQNLLCLTSGSCVGLGNVVSSGIVAGLNPTVIVPPVIPPIIPPEPPPEEMAGEDIEFNDPLPEDWGEEEDDDLFVDEDGGDGDGSGEGSITQDDSSAGQCSA